jgi:hypothetical protein
MTVFILNVESYAVVVKISCNSMFLCEKVIIHIVSLNGTARMIKGRNLNNLHTDEIRYTIHNFLT